MKKQKTAVIVVDPINALTRPGSRTYYDTAGAMMPRLVAAVEEMRTLGALIVFIASHPEYVHPRNPELSRGSGDPKYKVAVAPDAQDIDIRLHFEKEQDLLILKYTYSAFYRTDLAAILRDRGVEHVLVCGIKTNVCCRQTAIDAASSGFKAFLLADMVSTNDKETNDFHVQEINRYFAAVIDSHEAIRRLKSGAF